VLHLLYPSRTRVTLSIRKTDNNGFGNSDIRGIPVIKLLVGVQVVNRVLLPITLFFVWRLAANRKLTGAYANGRTFNILAGATVLATSTLSVLLLGVTLSGR
jgi:Mn2+/Fe2+ NRAMP family transporter